MRRIPLTVAVVVAVAVGLSIQAAVAKKQGKPHRGGPVAKGCVGDNDTGPVACAQKMDGLEGAFDVTLSEDGRSVYVAGSWDNAVAILKRNPRTGALRPMGCISDNDTPHDTCAQSTDGLDLPFYTTVSPDGRFVYASGVGDSAVVTFARNVKTGALTHLGCVDDNDTGPDNCAQTTDGLSNASEIAITEDGRWLYVAGLKDDAIAIFARNRRTGALTPMGCIDDNDTGDDTCAQSTDGLHGSYVFKLSPDDKFLYLAGTLDDAVTTFRRNARTGALTPLGCIDDNDIGPDGLNSLDTCAQSTDGLDGARAFAVTKNFMYVAGREDDSIVIFRRNPRTGALFPRGCIEDNDGSGALFNGPDPGPENCAVTVNGLDTPRSLDLSPDGRWLYAATTDDSALVRFRRNLRTGALSPAGCIDDFSGPDDCARSTVGLAGAYYVGLSEYGTTGYVAALEGDAIAIFSRMSRPVPDEDSEHGGG
jgi:6-phosphogluconolactonase (cycloisomerase 2 family)